MEGKEELLKELSETYRKMVRKFIVERDKILIEGSVTLPQFMILDKLKLEGPKKVGDLGKELDFTSGAITAFCDKLVKGGYAIRKREKDDRRVVNLEITSEGLELLMRYEEVSGRFQEALFQGFNEEELQTQLIFYRKILGNLPHMSKAILELVAEKQQKGGAS
ncbi:MarR family transcriptional regulator [Ectobacillus funiculus]|uniref:MarR family winged helix-turn-helix transcriptional regulator n=1 Tax=Ectobacillus funiculus TaxID=137993 RepID=UPI00397E0675